MLMYKIHTYLYVHIGVAFTIGAIANVLLTCFQRVAN